MLFIFPVSHTDVVNMCDVSEGKCLNKQVKKNTGCIIALYCPAWGGGGFDANNSVRKKLLKHIFIS